MIMRVVQGVMVPLFLMAAWVQLNDPDPLAWIAIYVMAAVMSLSVAANRPLWRAMGAAGAIALVWSLYLASRVLGQQPIFDEEGREMMGLALIALFMGAGALWGWKRAKKEPETP